MIKRIQILILTVWLSFNSMAQPTSSFKVFSQPDRMSEVIDKIPLQKKLKKVRESSDGRWIKITYLDQYKNPVSGWIEKKSVESDVEDVDAPNPWSFGFGLGLISSDGDTNIFISGDMRYLWNPYTETVVGLDLSLGDESTVGYRVGEKFFLPLGQKFVPYAYLGFRQSDVSDFKSSAYEPGVGFQYNSSANSYFDVGLNYLVRKPFNAASSNVIFLNASSGFRF